MCRLRNAIGIVVLLLLVTRVAAEVAAEKPGTIESLPQPPSAHWVGVVDIVLERLALLDLDSGRYLGQINGGYGPFLPLFSSRRGEIYIPATYYSRRWHGERTDVLEIHDSTTLAYIGEVVLPPKRATNAVALGHAALSDDQRFAAIFNWTTGTGLTVVDLEKRTVSAEITTPGCSLVYAAGPRRFFSICADGALFVLTLDEEGRESNRQQTQPFHDPRTDPVTEKAVRRGHRWLFASFEGQLHSIDTAGPEIKAIEPWSLLSAEDRKENWRIGGAQHLAVHEKSARLYSLVHRGGPGSHKEAGEEVWVYDLTEKRRVERIPLVNPGITLYGTSTDLWRNWVWPLPGLTQWLVDQTLPAAVSHIQVTRDDAPLLITASQFSGSLGVYDATSGGFLKRVQPTGWTTDLLLVPWAGGATR